MIDEAKRSHPYLEFKVGDIEDRDFVASISGSFDVILIVDTIGAFDDRQGTLEALHALCSRETRLIVTYYSHLWEPLLTVAEWTGWRSKQPQQNILSPADIRSLTELADFEVVKSETRLLSPVRMLGLGRIVNRFISILPGIRALNDQWKGRIYQRVTSRLFDGSRRDAVSDLIANKSFSIIFSWLLNQRFTDTLCGTKVLSPSGLRAAEEGKSLFRRF